MGDWDAAEAAKKQSHQPLVALKKEVTGMTVGCKVKVEDIGTLAVCTAIRRGEVELELDGERFWIPKRFCEEVE